MGMPHARPIPPKEKEINELSNKEKFSFVKTTKIGKLAVYFHLLILVMKCGRSPLKVCCQFYDL